MVKKILITGARAPVAVDLGRAFSAAGCEVHFADSVRPWAALCSGSGGHRFHKLPPPRTRFPEFSRELTQLHETHKFSLILPTCEEVFYVVAAGESAGFLDVVFSTSLMHLRQLHSKIEFPQILEDIGLSAPKTWRVETAGDLSQIPLTPEELVLKPEFSRFGSETMIKPSLKQMNRWAPKKKQIWAAQEFVSGEEVCFWAAVKAGKIVAHVVYRPKWRLGQTASYAFERVDIPQAKDYVQTIASSLDYEGHLSFDLIVKPDGQVTAIECNPRAVSGLHLFDASAELAEVILGKECDLKPAELRYLSLGMVALGFPHAVRSGRLTELMDDWRAGTDALGRAGDRLPVLGALVDTFRFAAQSLISRNSAAAQTTFDIEWNGEAIE